MDKDFSDSHFFHTDTSGRDNFRTTAMEDFIAPESMTGKTNVTMVANLYHVISCFEGENTQGLNAKMCMA